MTHSTISTKLLSPVFSRILLGSPAKVKDILLVGGVMGGIGAVGPLYEGEPVLFFLPVAWFLFVCTKVYGLLKNPRSGDLAFVLGLHYSQRTSLSKEFVKRKNAELAGITAVCMIAFLAVRFIAYKTFVFTEALTCLEIMAVEIVVLFGLLYLLVAIPLIRPSAKNSSTTGFFSFKPTLITQKLSSCILNIQRVLFLSKSETIVFKRQLLYLIRFDLTSFVFFNAVALGVAALVFSVAKPSQSLLLGLFCLIPPVILLLESTACMSESSKYCRAGTHYNFKESDIFIVNSILAAALSLPYLLMFLIKVLIVSPVYSVENILRIVSTVLSVLLLCQTIAFRWREPDWTNVSASSLGFTLLCGLIGISVPLYGFIFPLFGIVLVWWLNKNEKKTIF